MRCWLIIKLITFIACCIICAVMLGEIKNPNDNNYWKTHYISGSIFIGISCSITTSMLLWFMHDLYFAIRLHNYGYSVNGFITSSKTTKSAQIYSYHITYEFIDDIRTHKLVYNYCQEYLNKDLINLCLSYVGDTVCKKKQTVTDKEYDRYKKVGTNIAIKFDPKHSRTNNIISEFEVAHFKRDIIFFLIGLIGFSILIWILFQYYFVIKIFNGSLDIDQMLISIGLILACFMIFTLPCVIISWCCIDCIYKEVIEKRDRKLLVKDATCYHSLQSRQWTKKSYGSYRDW